MREQLSDFNQITEERLQEQLDQFLKDFKDGLLEEHGWPTTTSAYRVSKIALNAYTRILAKKFPNFCVNCVHPGYVKTDMNPQGNINAEEGARGPVMLALLPEGGPSGLDFDQMEVSDF
ncbi:hypothetical protein H6P81_013270 [Aristolochia fimbriata]|uniref:(+)-neomenthol dehydrogenase-like n=1 Tax=Aristolochia fimbriata TaxID=158543 RepID=A0AAV7EE85_ARIFI|nr:hypothetical protein H6P81_013270 [Aristolochia fimbriata]